MRRILAMVLSGWLLAGPIVSQQETESEEALERYHITPETTRITGPLDENGKLDFYAAINQRAAKGVTRDNNAARFILGTLPDGYSVWTEEELESLREAIELDWLPMDYPRLVHIDTFAEDHADEELATRYWDNYAMPMDSDEFPLIAMYVELNDPALDEIVKATNLPRFFVPLKGMALDENQPHIDLPMSFNETLISSDLHHIGETRSIARLLVSRAMLRIGAGDYEAAWSDILAVRRLGRLVGSGPTLIEGLVGISITGIACNAARELIVHAAANENQDDEPDWQALFDEWGEDFHTADVVNQFDFAERLMYIELITMIADDRIGILDAILAGPISSDGSHQVLRDSIDEVISDINVMGEIDWNEGLRWSNTFYDRLVANAGNADAAQRT
ncbi:MAG: hypothetical protein ACR2NP_03295, partial [Pirellulaceae bacterium]